MSGRIRLDVAMVQRGIVDTRSQAENWIRLSKVRVGDRLAKKPGESVADGTIIELRTSERYVSRAGLKLASVARDLNVTFGDKTVLDVGSSTGGFTDYALQHNARRVYAVDVGSEQLHPSLRRNKRIKLYEKTDIRDFTPPEEVDIVVMDVSFISLREILPHVAQLAGKKTEIIAMLKPQFEAGRQQVNKGIIKNDSIRRQILREFENWSKQFFIIIDKKDSDVAGAKGNQERFYKLRIIQ